MSLELENLKNQLEEAIQDHNVAVDKIYKISNDLDTQIIHNCALESNFSDKYKQYLNFENKEQIIADIKTEILNKYSNISMLELNMLSSNLYDFCCLKSYQLSEQEISDYLLYKNNCYYEALTDSDIENLLPTTAYKLEDFKALSNKYINILRKRL